MDESVQQFKNKEKQYDPYSHYAHELAHIQNILQSQAPLVSIKEINKLHQLLAGAAAGEYFLIQSGDCVDEYYQETTQEKLEFIDQLAEFFHRKTGGNVIQVGRMAGQSAIAGSNHEMPQKERIYPYFGDKVNQFHNRTPDPWRMLLSYHCSASIYQAMNQWNRELKPEQKIYTSHEALVLYYEQALTRMDKQTGLYYNLSTHFPWLGKRTIGSMAHMDYLKKIANPIAIKIGPDISITALLKAIEQLDPDFLPGRITLIPRLGAQQVHRLLPQLIAAVEKTKRRVLWSCDPMHGNTEILSSGIKVRKLDKIVAEITSSCLIHKTMGSQLNAIHLEATHQNVRECIDHTSSICSSVNDFKNIDTSLVAPRLNYAQTMHVIRCIAKYYVHR